ncbi:FMN-dependent NADH-azoreductase [Metabacillus sediminilitoris]|uniref:FMN dependent NADH:quinone oxidoreductase n=1 Tax=Metabacillus sediminilitoris TaxID=2567941 RepID=A0A4S4BXA5_9BACI|nr:FMN-dependent NADH-azoreductase [Metabacillus sediminilitoris]QGQ46070.1 FMN-dependent NADH-azoreductase [Metabacillus sediminilitoris]THF79754.1 FMN-dependent NADH-azoreductase [Metabacillus sediminilitoris]
MAKVLFVKANNRPIEQSVSLQLYHSFTDRYKERNPNDVIVELDLFKEELPYYGVNMINGLFKSSQGFELTAEERMASDIQKRYLQQFLEVDKVVFAFPLWNKTIPAVLHTYLDYLNVAGQTFKYTPEGPIGLVPDKKIAILNARGGDYSMEPLKSEEIAVNFVVKTLHMFGINQISTVVVEGHNQYPDRKEALITDGIKKAEILADTF